MQTIPFLSILFEVIRYHSDKAWARKMNAEVYAMTGSRAANYLDVLLFNAEQIVNGE